MLDRESIFEDEALVELLRTEFTCVAVAVEQLQHREGEAGDLYRKVVLQRRGMHLGRSTQGHYVFTPSGDLLRGSNARDSAMLLRHLRRISRAHAAAPVREASDGSEPAQLTPPDVTVVEVFSRVLEATWPEARTEEERLAQQALGRDFLWVTADERRALTENPPVFPGSLARRIARFNIVDNTRQTPLPWNRDGVRALSVDVEVQGGSLLVSGRSEARAGERRCTADIGGVVEVRDEQLERFDLTVRATFEGDGRTWKTGAPPGPYVVGIVFRLAESAHAENVPPHLAGNRQEYLEAPIARSRAIAKSRNEP